MKQIFKSLFCCFFIFSCPRLFAREIVLIENQASLNEGQLLKSILIKRFHIPKELITLKNSSLPCENKTEAIIHLCLESNGELLIKKINRYVVQNSLGVFFNQADELEKGESQ